MDKNKQELMDIHLEFITAVCALENMCKNSIVDDPLIDVIRLSLRHTVDDLTQCLYGKDGVCND